MPRTDGGAGGVLAVSLPEATMPTGHRDLFARWLGPAAREAQRATGIPASATVAMSIYETNGGRSYLAQNARNLFGMWALGTGAGNPWWDGAKVWRDDRYWRVYQTPRESLLDFVTLFYRVAAYAPALAHRGNARAFLERIVPTYAPVGDGNPVYLEAVLELIARHNLARFDVPPQEWELDARLVPREHIATWEAAIGRGANA